jgi:ABC-type transporter Mla MlaB component
VTIVRRTVETSRIRVIHENLDIVAVEIHGATLLTRADTAGILIAIRVTREIQVIGDRILVIMVPRETRVATIVGLVEMTDARHAMTAARVVTTVALVKMIDELTRVDPVRAKDVAAQMILVGTREVRV